MIALVSADPGRRDGAGIDDGLAACGRLRSWLDARQALFVVEASRRRRDQAVGSADLGRSVADRTHASARGGARRAKTAEELTRLPLVTDALASGQLTHEHASLLADAHRDPAVRDAVEAHQGELVAAAGTLDPDRFRTELDQFRQRHSGDDGSSARNADTDAVRSRRGSPTTACGPCGLPSTQSGTQVEAALRAYASVVGATSSTARRRPRPAPTINSWPT